MTKKEDLFEICLEELEKGRKPEEVCSAPQFRPYEAEFLELLQTVEDLRGLGEAVPLRSPAMAASGRAKLLAEAAKHRNRPQRRPWLAGILTQVHGFRWSMAMALLVAILFVTAAGHFVVGAAAHSLPGDPLYPVKQLEERVTLALTLDAAKRAALEQAIQQERLKEAREVAQKRRVTMLLQGVVSNLSGKGFSLGGVSVSMTPKTRVEGTLETGAFVAVRVHTDGKGHLLADEIMVKRVALAAMHTVAPTPTATAVSTQTPTPTASPSPTAAPPTVAPVSKPVVITATPTETETSTPTPTLTPTSTMTPTETPTVTFTPTPPRTIWVTFSGVLYSKSGSIWKIGNRDVVVTDKTEVQVAQGVTLETGKWAIVEATRKPDGRWVARKIVVTKSPRAVQINLQGEILSISGDIWNVGGTTILVPASATIHGTPRVGDLALVSAVRQPDGTVVASEVTIRTREEVTFEGIITSISDSQWVVGGIVVKITPNTRIDGVPEKGSRAQVMGWQNRDGSVEATHIIVLEEPTAVPTATPTSQPRPEPSITPVPQSTATAETISTAIPTPTVENTVTPSPAATGSSWTTPEKPIGPRPSLGPAKETGK